mgnify:CR=1 FL=1
MGVIFSVIRMTFNAVTIPVTLFRHFMTIISLLFLGLFIALGVMIYLSWDNVHELYTTIVGTGKDAKDGLVDTIDTVKDKIDDLNAKIDSLN